MKKGPPPPSTHTNTARFFFLRNHQSKYLFFFFFFNCWYPHHHHHHQPPHTWRPQPKFTPFQPRVFFFFLLKEKFEDHSAQSFPPPPQTAVSDPNLRDIECANSPQCYICRIRSKPHRCHLISYGQGAATGIGDYSKARGVSSTFRPLHALLTSMG